ncbi:hypothetical protein DKX38_029707 [Salix brachista]|uniref:ATP-dependent DNA helicase RecQ zinc-binding domain-containing protein n=1 Tax=Salix brachista TaxID=2182728 RepID=A0A5N5IZY5_9ROSI|nr:hypothetical protein DKX38_029707 [Salix brachista]
MEAKYKFIFVARVSVRTDVMHAVIRLTGLASYSENDVDCPRLLQLRHFGEKLDSGNCGNTCDSCSKIKTLVEKDVTESAKQLTFLISSSVRRLLLLVSSTSDLGSFFYCSV